MSDQVLGPTLSYFSNRMLYDTFDVMALLQQGDNAVGVWLAPGWFGDPTTWPKMPMPTAAVRARMVEPNRIRALTKPDGQERID